MESTSVEQMDGKEKGDTCVEHKSYRLAIYVEPANGFTISTEGETATQCRIDGKITNLYRVPEEENLFVCYKMFYPKDRERSLEYEEDYELW